MKTLKELRTMAGVSQETLADRLDSRQSQITQIESGRNSPTIRRLCETLEALGYSIELYAIAGERRHRVDLEPLTRKGCAKDAPSVI
jgi:hypothetical protein